MKILAWNREACCDLRCDPSRACQLSWLKSELGEFSPRNNVRILSHCEPPLYTSRDVLCRENKKAFTKHTARVDASFSNLKTGEKGSRVTI